MKIANLETKALDMLQNAEAQLSSAAGEKLVLVAYTQA